MTLVTKSMDGGLKKLDDPIQKMAMATHEGMASWAGGGPKGATCLSCEHFGAGNKERPTKITQKSGCHEWLRLVSNNAPKKFPADSAACRYYVEH